MTTEEIGQRPDTLAILDLATLEPETMARAVALADTMDPVDAQAVVRFGVGAQTNIADFTDTLLAQITQEEGAEVGGMLSGLIASIKGLKVDTLSGATTFWARIPLLGRLFDARRAFTERYERCLPHIERLGDDLERARMELIRDVTLLDELHAKNSEYLRELDLYIAAGVVKLEQLEQVLIPELEAHLQVSPDPGAGQRLQDLRSFVVRLRKKLHDLKISRLIALQTQPQIRLIQSNDQLLIEKIQSAVLNTLPLWKNQIIIALSLLRQQRALKAQREVTHEAGSAMKENSRVLRETTKELSREGARDEAEIARLKEVSSELIGTIDDALKVHHTARERRAAAELELRHLE